MNALSDSPTINPREIQIGRLLDRPEIPVKPNHPLPPEFQEIRDYALASLPVFCEVFQPDYRADAVHRYLCAVLELVEEGLIRRVCVSCPPRTGKSITTTVAFPAWALSRRPNREIIQGGFSSDLSQEFSVKTKGLLNSARYKYMMGDMIAPHENRQDNWKTNGGGNYFATNVGGAGVGRGADLLLIDDVFKDRAHARSAAARKAVWDWFTSVAMTRLSPEGVALVIGTRWHKEDLIGKLTHPDYAKQAVDAGLPEERWFEINIQAICENPDTDVLRRQIGETHWPSRWTVRKLAAVKHRIGPVEWAAQYQGQPRPDTDAECDTTKIKVVDRKAVPAEVDCTRGWDLSLGECETSDWSCGAYGGMDADGNLYLVHMDRKKRRWLEQKKAIIDYALAECVGKFISVEGVAAWKVAIAELILALNGQLRVKTYTPTKDKVVRATPWMALIDAGKFYMVKGPWNADFIQELQDFPVGSHDDQVDAVTILHSSCVKKGKQLFAI